MDNLNVNPALKKFFRFGSGAQPEDSGQGSSGLQQSLMESGQLSTPEPPPVITLRQDDLGTSPRSCTNGCKTAVKMFVLYLILGIILAILLKSMTVILAVTVVVLFILIQVLTASGMVAINWSNIGTALNRSFDRDGDGKFGWGDFKSWCIATFEFITAKGIPAMSGLVLGLFLGFRFS